MNEFERLLEIQLRRFLDPIVATPAPARRSPAEPKLELKLMPGQVVAIPAEVFA
jgi:hypothetical protein